MENKKQVEVDLESSKEHVQNEKAKLDKYLQKRIAETNQEINSIGTTIEWIEKLN